MKQPAALSIGADRPFFAINSFLAFTFAGFFRISKISSVVAREHLERPQMKHLVPWLIGLTIYALRLTCRLRIHNDSRAEIRSSGKLYVFAQLHAHQIAASMYGEYGTGAMVSRSADGEMIVPTLRLCGKIPVRGSSGRASKGGATALQALIRHVNGGRPAVIAVDGPRGPRGHAHKGICFLAQKTNNPVLPVLVIPARRWILSKTWDRLQIPKPFTTVHVYFGDPLDLGQNEDLTDFAKRVERSILALEAEHDPQEQSAIAMHDQEPPSVCRAA